MTHDELGFLPFLRLAKNLGKNLDGGASESAESSLPIVVPLPQEPAQGMGPLILVGLGITTLGVGAVLGATLGRRVR